MDKPTIVDRLKQSASWVTLVIAAFLIIFFFVDSVQNQKQQKSIDKQTNDTAAILQQVKNVSEQNKDLSKQNRDLSQQNAKYAYCNAVILAKYTQTGEPIKIEDLNDCVLDTFQNKSEIIKNSSSTTNNTPMNQSSLSTPSSSNDNSVATVQPSSNNISTSPPLQGSSGNTPQSPPLNSPPSTLPTMSIGQTALTPAIKLNLPCVGVSTILRVC
jgi:hypothetical protein